MPDPSLGHNATCRECGGDNERTERTLLGGPVIGPGPDIGERERAGELICTACHRRIWVPMGTFTPAPRAA